VFWGGKNLFFKHEGHEGREERIKDRLYPAEARIPKAQGRREKTKA